MDKVFVFGTLKEGFPNFHKNAGKRFRKGFETSERYPLYLVGERHAPWMVISAGQGYKVHGQVFDVDSNALAVLDDLERVTEADGYRRVIIQVRCLESGETFDAYVYGKTPHQLHTADIRLELISDYTLDHAEFYKNRSPA